MVTPLTIRYKCVLGRSIRREMDAVRKQLGVCPQHDVLWEQLTVYEHLALYATLKVNLPLLIVNVLTKPFQGSSFFKTRRRSKGYDPTAWP